MHQEQSKCDEMQSAKKAGRALPFCRGNSSGIFDQRLGDGDALHFAGALVNLGDLRITKVALDLALPAIAHPAEHLYRVISAETGRLRGKDLSLWEFDCLWDALMALTCANGLSQPSVLTGMGPTFPQYEDPIKVIRAEFERRCKTKT